MSVGESVGNIYTIYTIYTRTSPKVKNAQTGQGGTMKRIAATMPWFKWLCQQATPDDWLGSYDDHAVRKFAYDCAEDRYRLPPSPTVCDLQLHLVRVHAGDHCFAALETAWAQYIALFPTTGLRWFGTPHQAIRRLIHRVQGYIVAAKQHAPRDETVRREPPVVAVYDDGKHYWFYCPYCLHHHQHGRGNGHRVAHCSSKDSPYQESGYMLDCVGTQMRRVLKSHRSPHCHWCDAFQTGAMPPHLCPACLTMFAETPHLDCFQDILTYKPWELPDDTRHIPLVTILAYAIHAFLYPDVETWQDDDDEDNLDTSAHAAFVMAPAMPVPQPALTLRQRFFILQRDHFQCCLCGASPAFDPQVVLEVDHKISRAHGGTNDPDNLWSLCFSCNRGKGKHSVKINPIS